MTESKTRKVVITVKSMKLEKVFESIYIGNMYLKNRIVMAPMFSQFASDKGEVTDRMIDYYERRAQGDVGLLMVETTCIDYPLGTFTRELRIDDDTFIPRLNELVNVIHSYNIKTSIQLHHAGRQTYVGATGGLRPVSASEVPSGTPGLLARALTIEEIRALVTKFADGAERAKMAEFDAVEIHGSHGYLISQFLSPFANKRNDEYGGDLNRRMRFALEIVEAVRDRVGEDFPVLFRINGNEFIEGGLTIDEAKIIASKLEEAGVDAIHVSAGLRERGYWYEQPMYLPRGCLVHLAEQIKKNVKVPVITVGRINDIFLAEQILREGRADLVAMGRPFLADPMILKKAAAGEFEDIRKCIACMDGCIENLFRKKGITCTVNPEVGMEKRYIIREAEQKKKIVVVGGGPAGMEAAIVAAQRGHNVVLFEKENELGGQLRIASVSPGKEELMEINQWLKIQVRKQNVDIRIGVEATVDNVLGEKPDAVIVATGARGYVPRILGIDGPNVATADDILSGERNLEGEKIVVIGAGMIGCEMADFASMKNKKVTLVARRRCGHDLPVRTKPLLFARLEDREVEILKGLELVEVRNNGVVLKDIESSTVRELPADQIILAVGYRPNKEFAQQLRKKLRYVYTIGDCFRVRKLLSAIHEGYRVALNI